MADGITRRDFLGGLAATMGAAPLVGSEQAVPARPDAGAPAAKTVLTQHDFKYAGLFTLPFTGTGVRLGFSNGALAARRVGGELHFFVCGAKPGGDPVCEVAYAGQGRDVKTAPRARLVRAWGDIYGSKRLITSTGGIVTRGLCWANGQLYWTYGDEYNVAGLHDPSIGSTALNADGSMQAYGPWRTEEHSQKTRGYMLQIPDWFRQYTGGRAIGVGAPITSGNASSPWGAMLDAVSLPESGVRADRPGDTHRSIDCQRLIYHDITHKQRRDTNYKFCGWKTQYDCSKGSFVSPGTPEFNGIDMMGAAAWIDLPGKHGVVFLGQLSTAIAGYDYAGDTVPHYWYGPNKCCHGQSGAPVSVSTGDATGSSVPYFWIYDPADLARAAQHKVDPWGFEPAALFAAHTVSPIASRAGALYLFGGAYFDAESRSLFVSEIFADSLAPEPQPVIHVFTIA
jgi:hypothetical protein